MPAFFVFGALSMSRYRVRGCALKSDKSLKKFPILLTV
jgi:hypothetical protein